ncbi:hypothetical protein CEXT_381861 [Caerostris extrusa]|uniref:Uncharacterized protein n=1 Tax=Caerostris extrusa TaxID=172846 RepID=A0AAV4WF34_CAEEX|nr:hypothetical protein CEXT_381861 [Caerostris extrusa]
MGIQKNGEPVESYRAAKQRFRLADEKQFISKKETSAKYDEILEWIDPNKGNLLMKWSHGNSEKWGTRRRYIAAKHRFRCALNSWKAVNFHDGDEGQESSKWIVASMGLFLMKQSHGNSGKRESEGAIEPQTQEGQESSKWIDASMGLFLIKNSPGDNSENGNLMEL